MPHGERFFPLLSDSEVITHSINISTALQMSLQILY